MRYSSPILAGLVVAGLGWWFLWPHGSTDAGRATDDAAEAAAQAAAFTAPAGRLTVLALRVEAEDKSTELSIRGRTVASRRVSVRAETEGRVISEPLRRGHPVAAGDVLCRLDPGSRLGELAEAEAMRVEAAAEARAAESLSSKGFTSETTRFARQAALQAAEAQVQLAELEIDRLEILAPFDGMLETDTAELGARLGIGEECATVIDLSTVKAAGFVSEDAIDALSPGKSARVRLVNGIETSGEITYLSRVADPETRTYEVEVTIDNPDGRIRDGMSAEISVMLEPLRAHRLPQAALTLDDDGRLGVRLAIDGRAVFNPVTILSDSTDGVWVTGLPPVARVIVVGQEFVRDGRAIEVRDVGWDALG